jgi:hypothetical protein
MKRKILFISAIILASIVLGLFIKPTVLDELLEKIVFSAVSILVGLSIAVAGIFLGSINTIYLSIYKIKKSKDKTTITEEDISKIKSGLSDIVDELKDNAIFSVLTFIIIILLFLIKEMNIPFIKWFIEGSICTKSFIINIFVLIGTFLIFWTIYDSLKVVFKITKAFELIKE